MAKLPSIEKMQDLLRDAGVDLIKLEQEKDKLMETVPYYKMNRKLLWKRLCDEHNVKLDIKYTPEMQADGEFNLLKSLTTEKGYTNLRGYILHISKPRETKKQNGTMTYFSFVDETGSTSISMYQAYEGEQKSEELIQDLGELPAPVYLIGVGKEERNGAPNLNFPNFLRWEKIGVGTYDLPSLNYIYQNAFTNSKTEFEEDQFCLVRGLIIDHGDGPGWVGCPDCMKKLPVDEGDETPCGSCNVVVTAVSYNTTNIILGDEFGELTINFSLFSDITKDDIIKLTQTSLQPEVILGCKYNQKYGLSGKWMLTISNLQIDETTGNVVKKNELDQLDFSKEEDRKNIPTNGYDAFVEDKVFDYVKRIRYYGPQTPDSLARIIKDDYEFKHEFKVKPIIEELLKRKLVAINKDTIIQNTKECTNLAAIASGKK